MGRTQRAAPRPWGASALSTFAGLIGEEYKAKRLKINQKMNES
jgi:hypothetical protein